MYSVLYIKSRCFCSKYFFTKLHHHLYLIFQFMIITGHCFVVESITLCLSSYVSNRYIISLDILYLYHHIAFITIEWVVKKAGGQVNLGWPVQVLLCYEQISNLHCTTLHCIALHKQDG